MTEQIFNPFEDRLSRDIRNDLSEGLASAIETGSSLKLDQTVGKYQNQPISKCYKDYIASRITRYEQALETIQEGITDPIRQGLVLWDLELFFEVHEVLEHTWYTAQGSMKQTLQALIRAAGVYIKRRYGFNDSAIRIATKAIPVLEENRATLEVYFELSKLVSALKHPAAPPHKFL
jgi:hypothetical protein